MKKYLKRFIIYSCVATIVSLIAYVLWPDSVIGEILISLMVFLILLDVGRRIQNEAVKKRYFIYIGITVGEIALLLMLSNMLNVGTVNTWLGLVGANMLVGTILAMLFDIARFIDKKGRLVLHAIACIGVIVLVITNIGIIISGL